MVESECLLRDYDDASLETMRESFRRDGFVVFHNAIESSIASTLRIRLDEVLDGRYSRGYPPDKIPSLRTPSETTTTTATATTKNGKEKTKDGGAGGGGSRVVQVVNVHKSDIDFRRLATSSDIGRVVSILGGWERGARLAQDQVWHKPPGAPPLVFHRDSPYFMFEPNDVITVWIALDDMDDEVGPLEYVRGSHLWGDGRFGSCRYFFGKRKNKNNNNNYTDLLYSAARREGITDPESTLAVVSLAGMRTGGMSVHNGRTWHGSGRNASSVRSRRGYGLHFVPAEVRFTAEMRFSKLWRGYVPDDDDDVVDIAKIDIPEEDFPLTYDPRWQGAEGGACGSPVPPPPHDIG
ncbi:hypothetical protein ACHAXA_001428 [Cyclostephanos tholiformis]|uniref:Phytanoyl-CoA dioxygenase n=1 Tax=Cyclostephanos tholiformis TaxID=382380 RepID=A0ABD3RG98_9STRA